MRGLGDKRVLISGGSSGIGLAAAARFLEEGSRVFLCGIDPAEVEAAVAAGIGGDEFEAAYVRDRIPLGRAGRAEDVAAAYAFLASDDAAFIHGSALVIDGGQLAVM